MHLDALLFAVLILAVLAGTVYVIAAGHVPPAEVVPVTTVLVAAAVRLLPAKRDK